LCVAVASIFALKTLPMETQLKGLPKLPLLHQNLKTLATKACGDIMYQKIENIKKI
jgi:hypothetical protein